MQLLGGGGRRLSLRLLLCFRCLAVSGYDLGKDITLCWVTSAQPDSTPQRADCGGASVTFLGGWPDEFVEGTSYDIAYALHLPRAPPAAEIAHANIHSCNRHVGFCTPFVRDTPELSTHSLALTATLESHRAEITSVVTLPAGQYTMIAHIMWQEDDGTVHDLARARVFDVHVPLGALYYGLIATGAALLVALACIAGCGVFRLATFFRRLRRVARKAYQERVHRVLEAYTQTKRLAYPMVCMSYSDFKAQGKMISHEVARQQGLLKYLDTVAEIVEAERSYKILFVSHQWTCETHPDPKGAHFDAINEAIKAITHQQDLDEKKLLVWLDYTSIPQKAPSLQMLSISSLPVYASFSSHFLVVAPRVQTTSDAPVFTYQTYEARGWCRLEQWARITQRSIDNMFICMGSEEERGPAVPAVQHTEFSDKAMRILQGDFTHAADRAKMVDTMLGLYVMLLEESRSDYKAALLGKVRGSLDEVFPVADFEDLIEIADALVVDDKVPTECRGEELDAVIGRITQSGASTPEQEQRAFSWGRGSHRCSQGTPPAKTSEV